jgi:DNA-directed RNA polymerase alpha subunit
MRIEIKLTEASVEDITRLRDGLPEKVRITGLHEETQTLEATLNLTVDEVFQLLAIQNIIATPIFEHTDLEQKLYTKIEDLDFSVRTQNTFRQNKYDYVGDIAKKQPYDLLQLHGFGKICLDEVLVCLKKFELTFGMELESFPDSVIIGRIEATRKEEEQRIAKERRQALQMKLQMNIIDIGITGTAFQLLSKAKLYTVGQVVRHHPEDFVRLGFGIKSLKQIKDRLATVNLRLGMIIILDPIGS